MINLPRLMEIIATVLVLLGAVWFFAGPLASSCGCRG